MKTKALTKQKPILSVEEAVRLFSQLGRAVGTLEACLYWDIPKELKKKIRAALNELETTDVWRKPDVANTIQTIKE